MALTGAAILDAATVPSPTSVQSDWADTVAGAINGEIARRLAGYTLSADQQARVDRAALLDGVAGYLELKAPHGVLAVGSDGDAVRLGSSLTRALEPVFFAIAGPGIG